MLFDDYEERVFQYPTSLDDASIVLEQRISGWCQGGCDIVWSDLLPRVLAVHGEAMVGGKSVLELGAGCGLVGLVAARWASRIDITDGDEAEVELIRKNVEEYAPTPGAACAAQFLEWGTEAAADARTSGALLSGGYDVILAAQVVYVPSAIPKLVETIAALLAPQDAACCYLYNDAVSTTATQPECRALLDAALATHRLRAEPCALRLPTGAALPHADAYLLHITRV